MYRNNDHIYDAIARLQQITGVTTAIESSSIRYDAVAIINSTRFVVISKTEIRSSNKGIVISEINNLSSKKREPIIVIAKFIARDIAEELKEKGINYIDIAGNAYIKQGELLISIAGQKAERPSATNQPRAFQESGIKLIFNLLAHPDNIQLSYRILAKKTGIALGSVSIIMRELEDLRFVIKTKNKRYLKNNKELLERWILAYNDVLRPRLLKKRFRFSNKEAYNEWHQLPLNELKGRNIWGGEPGASILTKQIQPQHYTIYTDKGWQGIATKLKLIPDNEGDIEILSIFWNEDVATKNRMVAPTIVILAELMRSGIERNIETAKIIIENELQYIKQ